MSITHTDEIYMQRCLQIAAAGARDVAPNPMVGAVLVSNGRIIGEGYHQRYGQSHAEPNAIASVQNEELLKDATLYVSLEPCSHYGKTPPCAELIIKKRIPRVVIGMLDPNPMVAGRGVKMLQDAGVNVTIGVLEKECRTLNKRFVCYHEQHRPYIILKWAQSADGFIDKVRESREQPVAVLSNSFTKQLVHKMRAENMAILVGTRTAMLDNPGLRTTRWNGNNPLRIALDRTGKIPDESKLFDGTAPTLIFTEKENYTPHPNTTICHIDFSNHCWQQIMNQLYQMKINSLIVEGGSQVLNDLLALQLWDEIQVETSPAILGNGIKAPLFNAIMHEEENYDGHIMRHYRK